jgi:hypothetical protein
MPTRRTTSSNGAALRLDEKTRRYLGTAAGDFVKSQVNNDGVALQLEQKDLTDCAKDFVNSGEGAEYGFDVECSSQYVKLSESVKYVANIMLEEQRKARTWTIKVPCEWQRFTEKQFPSRYAGQGIGNRHDSSEAVHADFSPASRVIWRKRYVYA